MGGDLADNRPDVFISHSSEDRKVALRLKNILTNRDIRCWMAPDDIPTGKKFTQAIFDAIISSRIFVLLLSSNSNASGHVDNEMSIAFDHKATLMVCRLEDVEPSGHIDYFVHALHRIDAFAGSEKDLKKLADDIEEELSKPSPGKPVERHEADSISLSEPVAEARYRPRIRATEQPYLRPIIALIAAIIILAAGFYIYYNVSSSTTYRIENIQLLPEPPVIGTLDHFAHVSMDGSQDIFFQNDTGFIEGSPVAGMARFYNASSRDSGEFGNGWHLYIPYDISIPEKSRNIQGVSIPDYISVKDKVRDSEEKFEYGTDKDGLIGYFPDSKGSLKGVYLLTDGAYCLKDNNDVNYYYGKDGRIEVIEKGDDERWAYGFNGDRLTCLWTVPGKLNFDMTSVTQIGTVVIPLKLTVVDKPKSETLLFKEQPDGKLGYFDESSGRWDGAYILQSMEVRLDDKWGNSFFYNSAGIFEVADIDGDIALTGKLDPHCIGLEYGKNDKIAAAVIGEKGRIQYSQNNSGDLISWTGFNDGENRYRYDQRGNLVFDASGNPDNVKPSKTYWILVVTLLASFGAVAVIWFWERR